ncbi:hypothetical protein [Nocardia gamkensis]|uniref:hypothetical protein n=1 Tax=Nocardia gamkensis TaxID=352869 RepID=UPI000AAA7FB1|nr:hypothetical protein [Nocardia gamkensis]
MRWSSSWSRIGTDWTVEIDGKKYTPQEISARTLMKLKRDPRFHSPYRLGQP